VQVALVTTAVLPSIHSNPALLETGSPFEIRAPYPTHRELNAVDSLHSGQCDELGRNRQGQQRNYKLLNQELATH
jgi:hypothetical protein